METDSSTEGREGNEGRWELGARSLEPGRWTVGGGR